MRLRTISEALSNKDVEGYQDILPYYKAVQNADRSSIIHELSITDDEEENEWPTFTFRSFDGQEIEVFYDIDSKTISMMADGDIETVDDISVDGILRLLEEAKVTNEDAGALSLEMKPAQFNVALKKLLKKWGVDVKGVRVVNSYKWPDCNVQVYGQIPNELRKAAMDADGYDMKSVRDPNDIHYGNISDNRVSTKADTWIKIASIMNQG